MIITRPLYYYASNVAEDLSRILSPHLRLKQTVNTVNPYDLMHGYDIRGTQRQFSGKYLCGRRFEN